ncbi:hypothetical protein C8J56DRAFT_1008662 [Mycena floridula]|nr:hypothetical protein C8J56DRAFT_1008662 [Mycena floridula]
MAIRAAKLKDGGLPESIIEELCNPSTELPDISDPDLRLALDLFLALRNASQKIYTDDSSSIPDRLGLHIGGLRISHTGISPIYDDMCINSCHAYTGPFAKLEACHYCGEPRYDAQQCTIPLGPQIQALCRSLDPRLKGSDMVYDDIFSGSDYLQLYQRLNLTKHDILVSGSADGAQLYQNKKSDTWFAIHILNECSPNLRYKKKRVLVNTTIPGPNKPKNIASFMFRGLQHMSVLQKENNGTGIHSLDGALKRLVHSRVIAAFQLTDAVGQPEYDRSVGHHGVFACRLSCNIKGHHKDGSGHYYQPHSRPNNANIDIRKLSLVTPAKYHERLALVLGATEDTYEARRKATGISKPSILDGLQPDLCFPLPMCFTVDLMHMILNLGDLFIKLWRGQLKYKSTDNKDSWDWVMMVSECWKAHGKLVADATKYFPSSFHRPPCNPAEKINSGFKTTEYDLYLFGLGPGVFRTILPKKYWMNFCKLARGFRIMVQWLITGGQIQAAHSLLIQFVEEYEALIHFCCPIVHTLTHLAPEATRVGPGTYTTQRMVQQAQVNALMVMYPELNNTVKENPTGSMNLGQGHILLRKRSRYPEHLSAQEFNIINLRKVMKWGCLRLPNQQIICSLWVESQRASSKYRVSRMVKVKVSEETKYAEVRFFFSQANDENEQPVSYALISLFGQPDATLLKESSDALWTSRLLGDADLQVIKISNILVGVSMQPLPIMPGEDHLREHWFVVEKSGLGDVELSGGAEPDEPLLDQGDDDYDD